MFLTTWRKIVVAKKIGQLADKEKEKVGKLYILLDAIEFYKLIAIKGSGIFTLLFLTLLPLPVWLGYLSPEIVNDLLEDAPTIFSLCGLSGVLGYIILRILFLPAIKRKIKEIEVLLLCDPQFQNILEWIKEIDTDMIRNIGKILPQFKLTK